MGLAVLHEPCYVRRDERQVLLLLVRLSYLEEIATEIVGSTQMLPEAPLVAETLNI